MHAVRLEGELFRAGPKTPSWAITTFWPYLAGLARLVDCQPSVAALAARNGTCRHLTAVSTSSTTTPAAAIFLASSKHIQRRRRNKLSTSYAVAFVRAAANFGRALDVRDDVARRFEFGQPSSTRER